MPLADALAVSEQFRRALLAQERQAATRLVRAYGGIWTRLQSQIEALTTELDTLAAKGELSPAKVARLGRLKNLERQIAEEVSKYGIYAEQEIAQGATAAIQQAQRDARALTQAALPGLAPLDAAIMARWQSLNPAAVESLLGFLADDSPLKRGLVKDLGPAVAERVGEKLLEGIALGYNPRKVASIIQHEVGQGLTWSLRTARTVQVNAYREATRASYIANEEIVPRWEWRSARDERTCASCVAMDGTVHKANERLNDHWQGRCVMLPLPVSYRDLGFDVDEPPAEDEPTGEAWFAAQSPATQKAILGAGKYEAWQAGKFDFAQLSQEVSDPVWGAMRVEAPLKDLVSVEDKAA